MYARASELTCSQVTGSDKDFPELEPDKVFPTHLFTSQEDESVAAEHVDLALVPCKPTWIVRYFHQCNMNHSHHTT